MDKPRIPTNLRTLMILEILGRADQAMTATEIGRQIGLPKQTVHRLCASLEAEGYLARDDHGRRFRPGRKLRLMASGILHSSQFHVMRHQVMLGVAAEVGETVNFVVPTEKGMVYIDRVETDWPFRVQLPVGTHVPFHCTASGKAYLASLSARARMTMVHCLKLEHLTSNTLSRPEQLMGELKEIEAQGYAIDKEEFVDGMVAIAVPIHDGVGRYVASIAFHGPTQRLTIEAAIKQKEVLFRAARVLREAIF